MSRPSDRSMDRRGTRRATRRFLIVAEDSKSGLDYLKAFKVPSNYAEIVAKGGAGDPLGVVETGIKMRDEAKLRGTPFIHTWCVFDRDAKMANKQGHSPQRFNQAFTKAREEGRGDLTAIWINDAFELWYLLHFCYRDTSINRVELKEEISKPDRLGKYDKADQAIFKKLEEKGSREAALRHAKRLERANPHPTTNPSTNLHRLVDKLLELQQLAREMG